MCVLLGVCIKETRKKGCTYVMFIVNKYPIEKSLIKSIPKTLQCNKKQLQCSELLYWGDDEHCKHIQKTRVTLVKTMNIFQI